MFKQPAVIQETDIICSVFDKSLQCYPIIYFCEKVYLQTTSKSKFSYSKRVLELGSTAYYLHNFLITMSQIQISWCNYFYLLRYSSKYLFKGLLRHFMKSRNLRSLFHYILFIRWQGGSSQDQKVKNTDIETE